ncbi:MAG: TonB-dependent receptor, plug, partial [Acidobacteria bacterium]|nr:TonB-dependent receptor, plug [Acidobacteriota bacterium]
MRHLKSKATRPLFLWCLITLCIVPCVVAQETTAGLQGVVKDPSGGVIVGATVEVAGAALIGSRKVETDASGQYRIAALPPGEYTMTISAAGFRTYKQTGID